MIKTSIIHSSIFLIGLAVIASTGCVRPPATVAEVKPPEVYFDKPLVEDVVDYEDFTGRTVAQQMVEVRARVTGHLTEILFKDGQEIGFDKPLFNIDPKLYEAEWKRAIAAIRQSHAKVDRLSRDHDRAQALLKQIAISKEEAERISGELAEAVAAEDVAKAQERYAFQQLEYTHVKTPIAGRLGKRAIDVGNLVKADETLLTTIVNTDRLYVDFDVDDRTVLKIDKLVAEGKIPSIRAGTTRVKISLPDDERFLRTGTLEFVDNQLNTGTGTVRMRAIIENKNNVLSPGLFARIRVPIGAAKQSIMVPETAIGTDQGLKYLYVLSPDNVVKYRRVKLGLQIEKKLKDKEGRVTLEQMRVIEPVEGIADSGLKPEDRVITEGLQRVRTGSKVNASPRKRPEYEPSEKQQITHTEIAPSPRIVGTTGVGSE